MKKKRFMRRTIALILSLLLALSSVPGSIKVYAVGTGGTGARSCTVDGNVFLGGNYIELGIAPVGSFGTTAKAPTKAVPNGGVYFHPASSGISSSRALGCIGMVTNSDGEGKEEGWNRQTTDFFLPGAIDESFCVGWDKIRQGRGVDLGDEGSFGITKQATVDESTATLLKARSTGVVSGNLTYDQVVSFGVDDKYFTTTVTLKNIGAGTLPGVRYLRAFDPDQSKVDTATNDFATRNVIGNDVLDDYGVSVTAYGGTKTDSHANPYIFFSADKRAKTAYYNASNGAINFSDLYKIETNPIIMKEPHQENYADGDIMIYFDLGDMAPGQSETFTWMSSLDTDMSSALEGILKGLGVLTDYAGEKLTGLDENGTYQVTVGDEVYIIIADEDGTIPMAGKDKDNKDYDLTGSTLTIVQINEEGEAVSEEAEVTVAPRPEAPSNPNVPGVAGAPEEIKESDIETTTDSITIVKPVQGQEYSIDNGNTWILCEDKDIPIEFPGLNPGEEHKVITRIPPTDSAPASKPSSGVTVTTQTMLGDLILNVSGYTAPYDGGNHSISVSVPGHENAVVAYSTALDGAYSAVKPQYKDVCDKTVYYRITEEGYYPAYGSAKITISKKALTVKANNKTIIYGENASDNGVTYEGFVTGENESVLTGTVTFDYSYTANGNAGDYTITPKGVSSDNYTITFVSGTLKVEKAGQDIPTVTKTDETYKGQENGTIIGPNGKMEYSTDQGATYMAVSGDTITDLAPGIYLVRQKGDMNHNPSEPVSVTIAEGRQLTITLPLVQNGYTLLTDKVTVDYRGEAVLTFTVKSGYTETENPTISATNGTVSKQADGTYKVSGITEDTVITVSGVSDITAPKAVIKIVANEWKEFVNKITFGTFFKETQDVTIQASDVDGSGVKSIEYYISNEALTEAQVKALDASKWKEYSAFSIAPDRACVIYARVADYAGNQTWISSDGIVLDATAPVISGVTDGAVYCTRQTVTVTDQYIDTVTVNGAQVTLQDGQFTLEVSTGPQHIVVTDKAGNRAEKTVTVDGIHEYEYEHVGKNGIRQHCEKGCGHEATAAIEWAQQSYVYDGQAKEAAITYSGTWAGDKPVIDYTTDHKNVMEHVAFLTCADETVTGYSRMTITPKQLENAMITEVDPQGYTGSPLTPKLTVTYRDMTLAVNKDYAVTYSDNTDAGTAKAVITAVDGGNYSGTAEVAFLIRKAEQTSPDVTGDAETIDGKRDGSILGVTKDMEYSTNQTNWTPITEDDIREGTLAELAAGTYYVRYQGNTNHEPSPAKEVVIAAGRKLKVTFQAEGSIVSVKEISWNQTLTDIPKVPHKVGYDQIAPVWDVTEFAQIQNDMTVNAVYTMNTYVVTLTPGTGYTLTAVGSASPVNHGGSYTLHLEVAEGYSRIEGEFAVKVNGAAVELADDCFTIENITELQNVTVEGVRDITAPVVIGIEDGASYYVSQEVEIREPNIDTITVNGEPVTSPFTLEGNKKGTYEIIATDKAGNQVTYHVTVAPIADIAEDIKDITMDNVTADDEERIKEVREKAASVDLTTATEEEKAEIQKILDKCDALLKRIVEKKVTSPRTYDSTNYYMWMMLLVLSVVIVKAFSKKRLS